MPTTFPYDLKRIQADGLHVSVGKPLPGRSGTTLRLEGFEKTAAALSDLPSLAPHSQIQIVGLNPAASIFIATESAVSHPQILIGYDHATGYPITIGPKGAMEGHTLIVAPSRRGKSVLASAIGYQACRMGYPTVFIGLKAFDNTIAGSLRAACDSKTRFDNGVLVSAPFEYCSLQPGIKTKGFNYHSHKRYSVAKWLETAYLLLALTQGNGESNPSLYYYWVCAYALLNNLSNWGESFEELDAKINKLKLDRDTQYSTSGIRNQIALQASIEQANLPTNHPSNIDLARNIERRGAIYFDGCYQDVGEAATAACALFALAVIATKRRLNCSKDKLLILVIDEAQQFPRALFKQMVEQCAGSGIRLITAFHNLDQLGDQVETLSMAQVRLFLGAVPGGSTDRHIQSLFGTKKEYIPSYSVGDNTGTSYSQTFGGSRSTETHGISKGQQSGFNLSEQENLVWKQNDTLALNYNKGHFVAQISPGAELSHLGPRALLCERGGMHISFESINTLAKDVLENTPDTFLPGASKTKQLPSPEIPIAVAPSEKRERWLKTLNNTAQNIRQTFN